MRTFIPPKLYDGKGDLRKQWFVYYSFRDPDTGRMKRFKVFDNINHYSTKTERRSRGKQIIEAIKNLILEGWSPFTNRFPKTYPKLGPTVEKALQEKLSYLRYRSQTTLAISYSDFF